MKRSNVTLIGGTLVLALVAAGSATVTSAAWTDSEWVAGIQSHGPGVGTVDCAAADGAFVSRGAGRALSGSMLGINLDSLAEASGVVVENDGDQATVTPDGASPAMEAPAFADPVNVTALSAINLDLGNGMLKLPLDNSTGVLGQYGKAASNGQVAGASGYVTETGGIGFEPETGYPELASLQLSDLLGSLNYEVGDLLPDITDAGLEIGAVAGRAALDGCQAAWSGSIYPEAGTGLRSLGAALHPRDSPSDPSPILNREYLVSLLDLVSTTPTVGALVTGVSNTLDALESTVNGLASDQGVLDSLLSSVTGLLNGLVSGVLGLGEVTVSLSAAVDTSRIRNFLSQSFGDAGGVLTINPTSGEVHISTVALLQAAYPDDYGTGLNELPPNTNPLADDAILTALTTALGSALEDWIAEINALLDAVIDLVHVEAKIAIGLEVDAGSILLGTVDIGEIAATVKGSLADLLADEAKAVVTTDLNLGPLGLFLGPVVQALVGTLVAGVINDLGKTIGIVVEGVLGQLRSLPSTVTDLVEPVIAAVSGLYTALFLEGLVDITLNVQNVPNPAANPGPPPDDWLDGSNAIPAGQFDVAALRIGILDTLGANNVQLYLGRGSVGPVRSLAQSVATAG